MSLTCRVQVAINNISGARAAAIREALGPDNVDIPEGLALEMEEAGGALLLRFEGRGRTMSLISTIDEVLGHVQVVLGVTK